MGQDTKIEWADDTFNPWIGCTKVSPGCANCYAEALMGKRWGKVRWGKGQPRVRTSPDNWAKAHAWNRAAARSGQPRRVFCASLADWLDPEVDPTWLRDLLSLVRSTPALTWMLLTKRPELWDQRMNAVEAIDPIGPHLEWWAEGAPPANVWIGTTVEDQERADQRIPSLLAIPARIHFLSCEPLLGAVALPICSTPPGDHPWIGDESEPYTRRIDWIIVGGESGPKARPMSIAWARTLRDQAQRCGVAFHFKQWGAWGPTKADIDGRLLDGRTWDEVPA